MFLLRSSNKRKNEVLNILNNKLFYVVNIYISSSMCSMFFIPVQSEVVLNVELKQRMIKEKTAIFSIFAFISRRILRHQNKYKALKKQKTKRE